MKGFLPALLAPARTIRACPALASGVALTIGVGLGGCLALIGLLGDRLLAPLPYRDPSRLIVVENTGLYYLQGVRDGEASSLVSVLDFDDLRSQARSFSDIGGACQVLGRMRSGDRPRPVKRVLVTGRLLTMLGVQPIHGRLLNEADFAPSAAPAMMLTESTWRRRFSSDPKWVGRIVRVDDQPFTVVGVIGDASLAFLEQPSGVIEAPRDDRVISPLVRQSAGESARFVSEYILRMRNAPGLAVVGRLLPGHRVVAADAEVNTIGRRLAAEHPENKGRGFRAKAFAEWHVEKVRGTIRLLLAAALLVFIVASLNATGLVLAESSRRQTERAVRQALGASSSRLVAGEIGRAIVLTLPGGLLAVGVAGFALKMVQQFAATGTASMADVLLLPRVALAAIFCTVAAGLIAGAGAAWSMRPQGLGEVLKQNAGTSAGNRRHGLMKSFVTLQVAAATVLVIGSGLMLRSVWNILAVDLGFTVRRNVMVEVRMPADRYPTGSDEQVFVVSALRRIRAIPGVTAAGSTNAPPLSRVAAAAAGLSFVTPDGARVMAHQTLLGQAVTPGYFEALGLRLVRGRWFRETDTTIPGGAAVVDQAFCARFLGGTLDPLTLKVLFGRYPTPIVGVVGDVRPGGPLEPVTPMVYMIDSFERKSRAIYLVVRADGLSPRELEQRVIPELLRVDSAIDVGDPVTFEAAFRATVAARRQALGLLFGSTAFVVLLTALSVVSCLAQYVAGRRRDIAIRLALGAGLSDLARLLTRHVGLAVGVGLGEGALGGLALGWTLSSELYGLTGTDPSTLVCSVAVLAAVAVTAVAVPAWRASTIDPARTLKAE